MPENGAENGKVCSWTGQEPACYNEIKGAAPVTAYSRPHHIRREYSMSASSRDLSIPDGLILFLPTVPGMLFLYIAEVIPPDLRRTGAGAGAFGLCPAGGCLYRVRPFPGGRAAALLLVLFPEGTGEQSALSGAILSGPEFCFHSGHDAAGAQSPVPRCPGRGAVRLPAAAAHCPGAAPPADDRHIRRDLPPGAPPHGTIACPGPA